MRTLFVTIALVCLTAAGLLAADLPYISKWKLNVAKSDSARPT